MTTSQSYIRLRFPRSEQDNLIQDILHSFEPLGFLDEEDYWEAYFDTLQWDDGVRGSFVEALRREDVSLPYDIERFEKENWNKEWEESITPVRVSERILIRPSWHKVEAQEQDIVLVIDPKMSFGTGFHATTRLMLRLTERVAAVGDRVLDVGTGTGVLAIAALKLGAASAVGVDIDEWSRENAEENCLRNGIGEEMTVLQGSIDLVEGPFTLILSNITKLDNIDMLPQLADLLEADGRIVLSGFYSGDGADVKEAMRRNGLEPLEDMHEDEWMAISGEKVRA